MDASETLRVVTILLAFLFIASLAHEYILIRREWRKSKRAGK